VDAAVVSTFLPKSLAPGAIAPSHRRDAETVVLSIAEPTLEPTGIRWSLRPEARQRIVNRARQTGDLARAVERTASRFPDGVSTAMRACLTGQVDTSAQPLSSLEATRVAIGMLSVLA